MSRRPRHAFLGRGALLAFAHRGGAGEAPENTLPAFATAIALGYRYLETDVHLTRDGVLVAFHDARLDRVTDRGGAIAELGIADVEAADAGYAFTADGGKSFPFRGAGIRVPRLEELLVRWPDARVNIDPKSDECVAPLVALIERMAAWERVCIGSFSDRRLARVRRLSGGRACTSMGPRAITVRARPPAPAGCRARERTACRYRPASARSRSSRPASSVPRIAPACPSTSGRSTTRRRCTRCSTSASTA